MISLDDIYHGGLYPFVFPTKLHTCTCTLYNPAQRIPEKSDPDPTQEQPG